MKYQRYELENLRFDLGQTLRIYDLTSANRILNIYYFDFSAVTSDLSWWLEMSHPIKQSHTVLLRWAKCNLLRNSKMWMEKTQSYQYTSLKTYNWWLKKRKKDLQPEKQGFDDALQLWKLNTIFFFFYKTRNPINQSYSTIIAKGPTWIYDFWIL